MTASGVEHLPVVGVLGGTFDPVHAGHLHAAETVRLVFALPRVLLVPCAVPPHKSRPDLTPAGHRVAMLRLAVQGFPGLEVGDLEVVRGGISFTFDTLLSLASGPAAVRPLPILGMDALREIGTWHRHTDLLREFDVVAVDRPSEETGLADLPPFVTARIVPIACEPGAGAAEEEGRTGAGGRIYRVPIPPVPISSSDVRARAAAGRPLAGLVPVEVARYIQVHELYRKEARR
jgi:nicotinate-nucleotide adenylyltransferase